MADADLTPDITIIQNTRGVLKSAKALIDTIATRIQTAVDAALANGATAAELQPWTDELAGMPGESDALAAAVAANP